MAVEATPELTAGTSEIVACRLCRQRRPSPREIYTQGPDRRRFCDEICFEAWTRSAASDVASANSVYIIASQVVSHIFDTGRHRRDPDYVTAILRITSEAIERLHCLYDHAIEQAEANLRAANQSDAANADSQCKSGDHQRPVDDLSTLEDGA